MAFNAKNLHYEKQEPTFLRKLRGEHSSDRHNVQIARPQKDRLKTGDEDDGPTMVDESGGDVSKEEYEAMLLGKDGIVDGLVIKAKAGETGQALQVEMQEDVAQEGNHVRTKQEVTEIGAPKKRKQAKIVGNDVKDTDVVHVTGKVADGSANAKELRPRKKANQTKKKVKLSFDEPE